MYINRAIRKCRKTPENVSSASMFLRIEKLGPTDLVVAGWAQPCEYQLALIGHDPVAIGLFDDKGVSEERLFAAHQSQGFPAAVSGRGIQAAEFALTAHTINETILENRSSHYGMQSFAEIVFSVPIPEEFCF